MLPFPLGIVCLRIAFSAYRGYQTTNEARRTYSIATLTSKKTESDVTSVLARQTRRRHGLEHIEDHIEIELDPFNQRL